MSEPRILVLDIETSPNVAHVWGLWQQNVSLSQLLESTQVISFAAKWHGAKPVFFYSDFHDSHDVMVAKAHELMDEADAIIHYNGTTFDIPHLKREFVKAGLTPPSPHKDIDLLRVVKKQFRLPSNKLQYVSTYLGLKGKVAHTGHEMWVKCMAGDAKAWQLFKKYNKGDVTLTEELYDVLLPWISSHPHRGLWTGERESCQRCGSTQLQRRGEARTLLGVYPRLHCQGCGSWSRGAVREAAVTARAIQ